MIENNQGPLVDKNFGDIDYRKQIFDQLEVNPYEIVVAVARMARETNDKALKYLGPEVEIRPANLALKKLENKQLKFVYEEEQSDPGEIPDEEL